MKARVFFFRMCCFALFASALLHGSETMASAGNNGQRLRFPAGAPQLNYLRIQTVSTAPEPATEPLNGRIVYNEDRTSRISSPISGRIVKLDARPGDRVKAGQILALLDAPDLGGAIADMRKAEADQHLKQLALQRAKTLFEGEVLARKELESAEADWKQASAEGDRARSRLKNLAPGGTLSTDGRFALRTPMAGVIADRQVNPGAEVRPDNPAPLFVITDPSSLWASIDLPERDLGKVHVRQSIRVEVDAYPGKYFSGRITSIGATLDPATRRVSVRCSLDDQQGLLKPEMYARITPLAERGRSILQVPNAAVISEGLYNFVFVENAPGVLEKRRISLAVQGRDQSVVSAGLKAGERVVTTGALLLNSEFKSGGK
ncbi:MAG: efflux RND transporter periplasmic adaptor subunit [Sulfuricella denitrificans]|nr:efflux RND transporter periplasmic adaptor subunit [Sulfuricella denitrificans]